MVQPSITSLEEVITWEFSVANQFSQARYGTFDGRHWKQFMPGGTILSALHPPKAIPKAQYDHAKKISKE